MAASQIVPFVFENEYMVRTVDRDGAPWFMATDVCRVLEIANSRDAIRILDDDEKGVATSDTPGGSQQATVISEPGLYKLVMRSRKPQAKRFDRWVRHELLPAVRKQGEFGDISAVIESMKSMQLAMMIMSRQMEDLKSGFDNRLTTVNYITAAEIVAREGVRERTVIGRLAGNCATSLKAFCNRHNRMLECRERTGDHKIIFSEEVASLWLASCGRAMIRTRMDKFRGQGALKLTMVYNQD